jgi:hypothetical protein
MVSTTEFYVALQRIYDKKAAEDKALLSRIIADKLGALSETDATKTLMSGEYVDNFCKNIFDVSHVCARSLTEEDKGVNTEEVDMQLFEPPPDIKQAPIIWFLMLRAVDNFQNKHKRYPGASNTGHSMEVTEQNLNNDAIEIWFEVCDLG